MIPEKRDKNFKDRPLKGRILFISGILLLVLGCGIASFFYTSAPHNMWSGVQKIFFEHIALSAEATETIVQKPSVFAEKLEPIYEVPVRIYVKKQGSDQKTIDAFLVPVSLTPDGELETPSDWSTVGWYERSAKVGEEGNTILNGHYDDNYGRPAAFYNLKSLKVNDTVYLVDSFGRNFYYQVTEIFYVSIYDKDRVAKVLESEGSSLTLVTCGGVWIASEGTYNNRLVIKARKV